MEWLASAVTKLQSTIKDSTEEFYAEQAKYCGEETAASKPAHTEGGGGGGASGGGEDAGLEGGKLKHVARILPDAEAWFKDHAGQFKHVGLAMLNPLADDEGLARAEVEDIEDSDDRLPWERPGVSEELAAQMRALSKDHMAFLTLPPEDAYPFELGERMAIIVRLLQSEPQIERWRFLLVPKRLSEHDFFRNYFYQLALLAGDVSSAFPFFSPGSASPPLASYATLLVARANTPSGDSVGGSVVSVMAPSISESEQFELLSNEVLEGLGRSQLSECADALIYRASERTAETAERAAAQPAGAAGAAPQPEAPVQSELDSWEDELQAELARIELPGDSA